jgi:hypothetical protein
LDALCFSFHIVCNAASTEPAAATRLAMSGGFKVLTSCEGLCWWPGLARYDCDVLDDSDDTCESIEWLRGAVGLVSGLFGRDGGGMVRGEDGGEVRADESKGAETFRSCAYADGREG